MSGYPPTEVCVRLSGLSLPYPQLASPLHYAAGSKKADSVRLLLEDDWTGGKIKLEALDKARPRWALLLLAVGHPPPLLFCAW